MIKGCFVDGAEIPITCAHDYGAPWDCAFARDGVKKTDCPHFQPQRAIDLALDILGVKE
jgi:hypothetical protein